MLAYQIECKLEFVKVSVFECGLLMAFAFPSLTECWMVAHKLYRCWPYKEKSQCILKDTCCTRDNCAELSNHYRSIALSYSNDYRISNRGRLSRRTR